MSLIFLITFEKYRIYTIIIIAADGLISSVNPKTNYGLTTFNFRGVT